MNNFETIGPEERVRILESRYGLMRDRLFLINQNMINEYRRLTKEIKLINDDMKEIKHDINEIKNILRNVVNEMQNFATKDNVKMIEKYVTLWNPLNFVTENDVLRIIKERGGKHTIKEKSTNGQD